MELDLDKINYNQIEGAFDNHVVAYKPPFKVITGDSNLIKQIIIDMVDECNLHYYPVGLSALMVVKDPEEAEV